MRNMGLPPFNPFDTAKYERRMLPASTPTTKPSQNYLQSEAANKASQTATMSAYQQSGGESGEWDVPSSDSYAPQELGYLYLMVQSAASDPAKAAKAKFTGTDATKFTSIDQYLSALKSKIQSQFSGEA